MKNKKWRLAITGIVVLIVITLNLIVMMWFELIKNEKLISGWGVLLLTVVGFFLGILSAFGAFNSIDKKTMANISSLSNPEEPK